MASVLELVLFLMLVTLSMGIPMFEENPRPKRSILDSFNASEIACMKQSKMLYTDGKCYFLLHRPPCPQNHWLVMNKEEVVMPNGIRRSYPVCKPMRCMYPKVFWPSDGNCYSTARDKDKLCSHKGKVYKANIVITNSWGEGECACEPTHARHEVDVLNGKGTHAEFEGDCYPLYHQGPCLANQIFNATLTDGGQFVGRCVPNPCKNESNKNPGSAFAQLTPGGTCYKIGTIKGPCSSNERFDIHPTTKELTCINLDDSASVLHLTNTAERCDGNVNHVTKDCRVAIDIDVKYYVRDVTNMKPIRKTAPGQND